MKHYWICLSIGDYLNSYDDNGYYYSQIGNLQITDDSEELFNFAPNEVWHEITEDEYKKASENDNFVLNYDDIHCIGKCIECQRYIGRRFIGGKYIRCDQIEPLYPDPYFKKENAFHACCIINKEYVDAPKMSECIKNAKNKNSKKHFVKCIIIYMFSKILSLIKKIKS